MDLAALTSVEAGHVGLVRFVWPLPEQEDSASCIAYVVMKREAGFLLCVPVGFFTDEDLQAGQLNEEPEGLGPSLLLSSPAVQLAEGQEWRQPEIADLVPAVIVDLPASAARGLSRPNLVDFSGLPFLPDDPSLFPLASYVLQQAREWVPLGLAEARSGYFTAAEEPPEPSPGPKGGRPKQHTVATLAQEQANMRELMAGIAKQL